jgi:hypothetical protein
MTEVGTFYESINIESATRQWMDGRWRIYRMRSIAATFLLLCALVFAAPLCGAEKPLGLDEFNSVDDLASAILAYFPKVQGDVTAVQGDQLTIALGKKNALMPGMVLGLWRDGKEILHPVTGIVIGHVEEEVGSAEVTRVGDISSVAVVRKKLKEPKPGDRARITPKKIHLALVPLRADRPEIIAELTERLNESGRCTVVDGEKVSAFLKDKPQKDSALIKEMGRVFSLDVVVAVGVYPSEGRYLVTSKIFYAEDARPLATIVATMSLATRKDALGEIRPFFAPLKDEKSGAPAPALPFAAKHFVAADLDGDGTIEYVFSDGVRLHLYRQDPTGWREIWTEASPAISSRVQHLYLGAADINGTGRPQIFLTTMEDGKVSSSVLEASDGTYRRIVKTPGFFRVINYPGRGPMLIGQDFDPERFFVGTPKQYTWSGGKYNAGAEMPLPVGIGLYDFAFVNFGEPGLLLVAFDERDHVLVYSKGTVIWKSEERYQGGGTEVVLPAANADKGDLKVKIKGKILALDIDGDGKDEILLPRNVGGTFFGWAKAAQLHALGWTGARLEQEWEIKDIPGAVLDLQAAASGKGPAQILTLVGSSGGLFKKKSVQLMVYSGRKRE